MKDLHLYFEPVNKELFSKEFENGQIGSSVDFHFKNDSDVCNCQIVILGVPENRNSVSEKDSSFSLQMPLDLSFTICTTIFQTLKLLI